ncbi:MAG: type II toxin-antitoxin system RelE family toxin [Candidatus Anammoxibacter sp.]
MKIKNIRQLKGGSKYYRIQLGDYRIGIKKENEFIVFIRILHRRETYRHFP